MITFGKLPRGLLALVGAQNFGENPRVLGDVVSPVIDITQLLLLAEAIVLTGLNAAPIGGFNSVTVASFGGPMLIPPGEVWNVRLVQALCNAGAGASAAVAPVVRMNNVAIALASTVAVAATTNRQVSTGPIDLWLPSGAELGVLAGEVVLAPTVGLSIFYSAYRA